MSEMKMQANAADAGVIEFLDLGSRRIGLEQGNATITAIAGGKQITQHGMIAAVTGRVHEHAALKSKKIMQPEQSFLGRIRRRERPVRCIGKFCMRTEDVEMRITCQRGQLPAWFFWIR